jgi:hypothetical protein
MVHRPILSSPARFDSDASSGQLLRGSNGSRRQSTLGRELLTRTSPSARPWNREISPVTPLAPLELDLLLGAAIPQSFARAPGSVGSKRTFQ